MNVFVLLNTKEDILKNVGNRAVLVDFHRFFSYYGSQWCPKTAWLQTFFKISSFVFSRTETFIQVWNYLRVSKWWQNFHFWVNYPFNIKKMCIVHKWYSKLSLIIIFISGSLKQYVSKYVNRFELYLVWNKCILNILLFYYGHWYISL